MNFEKDNLIDIFFGMYSDGKEGGRWKGGKDCNKDGHHELATLLHKNRPA